MKKQIIGLLNALDPRTTTKIWTLDLLDWTGGWFYSFWTKKEALKFAKENTAIFVYLKNELTGEEITLKDNPDNIKPPRINL